MESLAERRMLSLFIAIADLTHFASESSRADQMGLAAVMDDFYERLEARVAGAGGTVVKFMGDAALIVFPEDGVDAGAVALLELKQEIDDFFSSLGWQSRLVVKAHFGPVVAGPYGGTGAKRFDLLGRNVNIAATLETRSFAISAEAFRRLGAETRRRFKKHTPPVTYIPLDAPRP